MPCNTERERTWLGGLPTNKNGTFFVVQDPAVELMAGPDPSSDATTSTTSSMPSSSCSRSLTTPPTRASFFAQFSISLSYKPIFSRNFPTVPIDTDIVFETPQQCPPKRFPSPTRELSPPIFPTSFSSWQHRSKRSRCPKMSKPPCAASSAPPATSPPVGPLPPTPSPSSFPD